MKKVFGFTIMELLISISIFLIITAMVIVNFRSGQYRDELMGSAQILQSTLREMQTLAFSGSKVICPNYDPPTAGEMTPAGYGLNINFGVITAFADCDPQDSNTSPDYKYGLEDVNLKTISLYNNVTINSIIPFDSPLDVLFTPSSEIVKVNSSDNSGDVLIELVHSKTNKTATVKITQLTGQIFIQ